MKKQSTQPKFLFRLDSISLSKFTFSDRYFNLDEGDRKNLAFEISFGVEVKPDESKVIVTIKFKLACGGEIFSEAEAENQFLIKDIDLFIRPSSDDKRNLDFDVAVFLTDLALHHTRAIHALEMQKKGQKLFIPTFPKQFLSDKLKEVV